MLSCKVGNTIINCFDEQYDKYKLKRWSEENRLICPDCGKPYEYCHGHIVSPYFRHKEKSFECDEIYRESETEEHIKGKTIIYKWLLSIKDECGLENIHLEHYIKETRQKPDVYFEQNGQRYAIEFQCTPIATEYINRRELYKLAGVNDIWILGCDKYTGNKAIEKCVDIKLNVVSKQIKFKNIDGMLTHTRFERYLQVDQNIDDVRLKNGIFNLDRCVTEGLKDLHVIGIIDGYLSKKAKIMEELAANAIKSSIEDVVDVVKCIYDNTLTDICVSGKVHSKSPYNFRIDFKVNGSDEYSIFIKDRWFDVCSYNPNARWNYSNISHNNYDNNEELRDMLFDSIVRLLERSYSMELARRCMNVLRRNREKLSRYINEIIGVDACALVEGEGLSIYGEEFGVDIFISMKDLIYGGHDCPSTEYYQFAENIKHSIIEYLGNTSSVFDIAKTIDAYDRVISTNGFKYEVYKLGNYRYAHITKNEKIVNFHIEIDMVEMSITYNYAGRTHALKCGNIKDIEYLFNYLVNKFKNICS